MTSPPGGGKLTRPNRASIGPASRMEARMRAPSAGSSSRGSARAAFTSTLFDPVQPTVTPRWASSSSIVSTSRMCGTFSMRQGPSASRGAARMGSAAFLLAAAPMTALALGWLGATLGAQFEWRYVRRIPRDVCLLAAWSAASGFAAVALAAALLARLVPALGMVWTPRLPVIVTLAAVAAASGPGAVTLVARTLGLGELVARRIARAAVLETAAGALAITVPLALHNPHARAGAELGWPASLIFAVGSGALVGMAFLSVSRLRPAPAGLGFAPLATLRFGTGLGHAADLSPLVVCALAAGLIVNLPPLRYLVRQVLADWAQPLTTVMLVVTGALLTLPTAWLLVAAPLLALVRIAAKWGGVRFGREATRRPEIPPLAGLTTVPQGATALALGLGFFIQYGGPGTAALGGVSAAAGLTTVVVGVAVAQLAAAPLVALALRVDPPPLTRAPR